MELAFAMRPHENARYQAAQCGLSVREMDCLLFKCGCPAPVQVRTLGGADFLVFTLPADKADALPFLLRHSCLYFASEITQGVLRPLDFCAHSFVPPSMPHIEKYKGKTNATFTRLLINLALCACSAQEPPGTLLDPICGRGTALFSALTLGMNGIGVEQDAASLREAVRFTESFLSYEHIPHSVRRASRTLQKGRSAPETSFTVGAKGDTRSLTFLKADTRDTADALSKQKVPLLVADLPYGVQHAPGKNGAMDSLPGMLKDALPVWRRTLQKGGGAAISFNTYTLPRANLEKMMTDAGFTVLSAPFAGFEHWVEQAVSRDILVAQSN